MPAAGPTLDIGKNTELHKRLVSRCKDRVQFAKRKFLSRHDKWRKDEEKILAYLPEKDADAARRVDREVSGKPQYTTIVVPYSYAVLMASHTYWTTVFLGRSPILQYQGRHGEGMQSVQAIEALMDYQVNVGGHLVPYYLWLMDAGKYGVGILGHYWDEEMIVSSRIVEKQSEILGVPLGSPKKERIIEEVPGYQGTRVYNVRPYDALPDPRVPLHRFQEGEFFNIYTEIPWHTVKERDRTGQYTNIKFLKTGDRGGTGERQDGSGQLELPSNEDAHFEHPKSTDVVKAYECYIRLVPSDWGLGKSDRNEMWVITILADFSTVIGAQPHGSYHGKFPFDLLEFEPEAYSIVNRSIPEVLDPIQRTIDWLINSHFYNVRKTLNDQFVVDPSRVVMEDFQDPLPGGAIRLKPAAYGQPIDSAIKQLAVTDVTQSHLSDLQFMIQIGERTLGVNDQLLGAQQAGGRKTATEIRSSTTFGISRQKTVSEYFSAMGWAPMSQKLVQETQQRYQGERKFRIVGDLALDASQSFVDITPERIAGFYDWVPVDGTLPVDRQAMASLWTQLLGQMRNFPEVAQQYDMARIFAWVAQLAGLKNIHQFKVQVVPDVAAGAQAQAGNVIPLGPGSQSGRPRDTTRTAEPGQVPGLGTTG